MKDPIISISTSATDITSLATSTSIVTLSPDILKLPHGERDALASAKIIENNPTYRVYHDELPIILGDLIDGKTNTVIKKEGAIINIINITGNNAIININDQSMNVNDVESVELFDELKRIVFEDIKSNMDKSPLISKIDEMEKTKGTNLFSRKYSEFIAIAADHLTLFTPILPALTKWLQG